MAIGRDVLQQIGHLVRPIATRVANTAARAVIQLVDDSTKMQLVQIGVLDGETIDNAEHFQPYGFTAVPLAGAEGLVLFPGGDRSHPLVFAVADRRYAPTGRDPGEVTMRHFTGAQITMTIDGDIVATPAAGRNVLISTGGAVDSLVTKTEFNAHTHATAGTGAPSPPAVPATGTTVLKAQ